MPFLCNILHIIVAHCIAQLQLTQGKKRKKEEVMDESCALSNGNHTGHKEPTRTAMPCRQGKQRNKSLALPWGEFVSVAPIALRGWLIAKALPIETCAL